MTQRQPPASSRPAPAGDAIRIQSLTKRYGRRTAVEGLDLAVPEGSLFGFLGPNGSGKTTTIRVLLGLLRPTAGRAAVLGLDAWRDSPRIKEDVGYLPGDPRLYPWLTGAGALRLSGAARGRDLSREGGELAERFDLDLQAPARTMSRGTRQKLAILLALAHRPRLLVLDEPTSSLDPLAQAALQDHLRGLARAGHTVFFSSHVIAEVERLCDRVAILREGRLIEHAAVEALRKRAPREVRVRWRSELDAAREPPPFVRLEAREGASWRGVLAGSSVDLVRWAAGQPIEDLEMGPPDLEALFHRAYRGPGSGKEPAVDRGPPEEPAGGTR